MTRALRGSFLCRLVLVLAAPIALTPLATLASADEPDRIPQFERDVLPIFTAHCLKCHGLEGRKAGLDLRTVSLAMRGGEHGPVIVHGSSEQSVLFNKVS